MELGLVRESGPSLLLYRFASRGQDQYGYVIINHFLLDF